MLDDELLGESNWRGPSGLRKKPFYRRTWFSALLAFAILASACAFGVFVFLVEPLREKAETYDLEECKKLEAASIVYDRNGNELGRLRMLNRIPVKLSEVPAHFKKALISQEDSRFYEHHGVDWFGILRAVYITIRLKGKETQGASTITQQLARQTFGLTEKTKTRKILEAFVAMRIEKYYSKDEIMELYLNRIYFGGGNGQNFYGVQAAARGYFGKEVRDLNIEESATICGLIKAPNLYSPLKHRQASIKARNMVIRRMLDEHYVTLDEAVALEQKPMITVDSQVDPNQTYAFDKIRQEVISLVGEERSATGGFHIYTSIDLTLQAAADQAVTKRLLEVETLHKGWPHQTMQQYKAELDSYRAKIKSRAISPDTPRPVATYLQAAAMVVNNADGSVLAVVGGRNFRDSQFNRATQSKSPPGTAFTPFVFATAFTKPDFFPASQEDDMIMDNRRAQIGGFEGLLGEWGQELPDESLPPFSQGRITLREILVRGQNAGAIRLGEQVTLPAVVDLAAKAGIESAIKPGPASFLGVSEMRLDEMCLAYSTFPNKGLRPKALHVVNRIADSADKTIYQLDDQTSTQVQVMDEIAAWQTNSCLMDVMKRGTGAAARRDFGMKDFPVAGKTGTDPKFANMWQVGYTSAVTCGVWVGFDKPTTLYPNAFSNRIALPIWADIMNAAVTDYKPEAFTAPENAEQVAICTKSGMRATDFCYDTVKDKGKERRVPTTYTELVRPGMNFEGTCTVHKGGGGLTFEDLYPPGFGPSRSGGNTAVSEKFAHIEPVRMKSVTVLANEDPYHSVRPLLRAVAAQTEDGTKVLKAMPAEDPGESTTQLPFKLKPPKSTKIEE